MSDVEVQRAGRFDGVPPESVLVKWAEAVLESHRSGGAVTVRIVAEQESARLNETYRGRLGKRGPTNVLAFPFDAPGGTPGDGADRPGGEACELPRILGDLVICAPVLAREAAEQGMAPEAHWAHIVVHGILHLIGYDHAEPAEAETMEEEEARALRRFGYPDPYSAERSSGPPLDSDR